MALPSTSFVLAASRQEGAGEGGARTFTFEEVYASHARFIWRTVCRLGVPPPVAEDVMQEIFLVVHRRLPEFEERSSVGAWLFAIVIRVVRAHRRVARTTRPAQQGDGEPVDPDTLADTRCVSPLEAAERQEAAHQLYAILDELADERREVFVLAELEQLSAPEIAQALGVNLNTVYWRLRTARSEFERALQRHQAKQRRMDR